MPNYDSFDVFGGYNLQAASKNYFRKIYLATSLNTEYQPDIAFNPYEEKFMSTYFDGTEKKLLFLTSDKNLTNPDSWTIVSPGYNDSTNFDSPVPKVICHDQKQAGANVWTARRLIRGPLPTRNKPYQLPLFPDLILLVVSNDTTFIEL